MTRRLSAEEIRGFRRDGFIFPIPVFTPAEIGERYSALQAIEGQRAGRLPPLLNFKPYLLVPWLWDLIHEPRILDPVEDLLGPDILCWEASFFSKAAADTAHVPWHQDATYWGLSENQGLTAWVAFTPSIRENGCMRVVPRSHLSQVPHGEVADRTSMLPLREEILVTVEEDRAVDVVLAAGDMSLHDPVLIHGSEPNASGSMRVGFAIRYIPGHVRQRGEERGTATLVRGADHGSFDLEQPPEAQFHPAARARHNVLLRRFMKIVGAEARRNA